ncbi:MAG: Mur ligase family protein [Gammaproteobacteria bacterium]|nr:Mur ligase family protein [Gammaproteobacteria bacterium]
MIHSKSVISVTGTNGKGSTVAFCEAILLAAGYRVGAYYSPHVFHISERVKINGKPITLPTSDNFNFAEFTQQAIDLFNETPLDAVILEVGIGGRLDPVNLLIEPDVSGITNVEFDHQDRLGNTLESIGFEKAHLYRPHKPAIFGAENIPKSVLDYAKKIQTELSCYKKDFNYKIYGNQWEFSSHKITYKNLPLPILTLHDAAIALEALSYLPLDINYDAICEGLRLANLPGRFKIITEPVMQIFDVAHNPASALLLAEKLKQLPCEGKTFAVVDIREDKDISGTLRPLLNMVDGWFVGSQVIGAYLPDSVLFSDIGKAYQSALKQMGPKDRILVFGSFKTVGALCPDKN